MVRKQLEGLSAETQRQVMAGGAMGFYGERDLPPRSRTRVVRRDLLGVVFAVAAIARLVPGQRGRVEFAFGRRDQVEMPAGVAAADQRAHIRTLPVSRQCAGIS